MAAREMASGEYIALEFKGMSGAGAIEVDKNLTFRIRGLNNIHVLDCFVNVALEPADGVVDFGKINSRTIKNTSGRRHNVRNMRIERQRIDSF